MFSFALVSPLQGLCAYLLPTVFLGWDLLFLPQRHDFVVISYSRLTLGVICSDMVAVNDVSEQEDEDDERVVFGSPRGSLQIPVCHPVFFKEDLVDKSHFDDYHINNLAD